VFDEQAELLGRAYREFSQHFPRPGWVEHDAAEIWEVSQAVAARRSTTPAWDLATWRRRDHQPARDGLRLDPETGEPLHRAIVWQDRRTAARCDQLREAGYEPLVRERTGLVLDPYFSATKIEWLLENVDDLRERATSGRAVFGTVDAWLLYKLTGERATDASTPRARCCSTSPPAPGTASCSSCWESRALPSQCVASCGPIAKTRPEALHGHAVPVAALPETSRRRCSARPASTPDWARTPMGPGRSCSRTPAQPPSKRRRAARHRGLADRNRLTYALEAAIFVTGAAVQWLRDGLGIIELAADTESLAGSLDSNDGVYFVPALTGLGSPTGTRMPGAQSSV